MPTIAEMDELILAIRFAYKLNEEEIAEKVGYNRVYISQSRSRNTVSSKFINALLGAFPDAVNIKHASSDEHALMAVLIERVASLLSDRSGRSAQIEREIIVKDAEELRKLRNS